ncbi:uncharacterized protein METZ01_LOCUS272224, partial [marine metagenome]
MNNNVSRVQNLTGSKSAGTYRRFFIIRSQAGFTMIELIAVMVIMTILASSTIGSYSGFNRSLRLFEEVRDMSRKIQYARDYCIARNESFWLKVDDSAIPSTYSLFHNNSSTALVLPDENSNTFELPGYADITSTNIVAGGLEFDALGEPQVTANASIVFESGTHTIVVVTPTG